MAGSQLSMAGDEPEWLQGAERALAYENPLSPLCVVQALSDTLRAAELKARRLEAELQIEKREHSLTTGKLSLMLRKRKSLGDISNSPALPKSPQALPKSPRLLAGCSGPVTAPFRVRVEALPLSCVEPSPPLSARWAGAG